MLSLIEKYSPEVHAVQDLGSAEAALAHIAEGFGFRSAALLEFTPDLKGITDLSIDTVPGRHFASQEMLRLRGMKATIDGVRKMIETGTVVRRGINRVPPDHPYRDFLVRYDLVEVVVVPISLGNEAAGLLTYSGSPDLTRSQMTALEVLSCSLFAQVRSLANAKSSNDDRNFPHLTPRERQVMQLSALGKTSDEIANSLGMSARTANQHFENVAGKLGTQNRTHTIAELVRRRML